MHNVDRYAASYVHTYTMIAADMTEGCSTTIETVLAELKATSTNSPDMTSVVILAEESGQSFNLLKIIVWQDKRCLLHPRYGSRLKETPAVGLKPQ